jgi:hypothetical protein
MVESNRFDFDLRKWLIVMNNGWRQCIDTFESTQLSHFKCKFKSENRLEICIQSWVLRCITIWHLQKSFIWISFCRFCLADSKNKCLITIWHTVRKISWLFGFCHNFIFYQIFQIRNIFWSIYQTIKNINIFIINIL